MPINFNNSKSQQESPESKMRTPDRVFKLELIDGTKPLNSIGEVDTRLFKDGDSANRLHSVMDLQTSLWSLKYDKGTVPPALHGMFTSFNKSKEHAENYFRKRNIQIVQVFD